MVGNLTHIMRILLALTSAYFATNNPFGEKWKDFFWVFAMTMLTLSIIGILYSTGEYWQLW